MSATDKINDLLSYEVDGPILKIVGAPNATSEERRALYDAAPLLPKGTILKVTAWHDNTTAKKSNPDPNQWVGWGDRTVDEMAHAWINIVYMKDEDFKVEQEKRRAMQAQSSQQQ